MTIKVGIVGCGGIAGSKHLPSLMMIDDAEVAALFDVNIENAERLRDEFGLVNARIYDNYSEMLDDNNIDSIHICTPNGLHASMSIEGLKKGKHVLVEKPMAPNFKDAQEMVNVSKETGKKLSVSMQNRFRKDSLYLKDSIENGELGEIYYAKAQALRRRAVPVWGDFLNKDKQGGGAIIDIGVHALDLTLWLMDNYKPKHVVAKTFKKLGCEDGHFNSLGSWDGKDFQVDESGFAFITMENEAVVILECSWALNQRKVGEAKCQLSGTKGGADMDDGLIVNTEHNGHLVNIKPLLRKDDLEYYDDRLDDEKYVEIKAWIECLVNNTEPKVCMEEMLVVTKIIDGIYESSKTSDVVYLQEVNNE